MFLGHSLLLLKTSILGGENHLLCELLYHIKGSNCSLWGIHQTPVESSNYILLIVHVASHWSSCCPNLSFERTCKFHCLTLSLWQMPGSNWIVNNNISCTANHSDNMCLHVMMLNYLSSYLLVCPYSYSLQLSCCHIMLEISSSHDMSQTCGLFFFMQVTTPIYELHSCKIPVTFFNCQLFS